MFHLLGRTYCHPAADTKSVTVTTVLSTAAQLAVRTDPKDYTLKNSNVSILRPKRDGPSRALRTTKVYHGHRHPNDGIGCRRIHRRGTISPKTNQGPEVLTFHNYRTSLAVWRKAHPPATIT